MADSKYIIYGRSCPTDYGIYYLHVDIHKDVVYFELWKVFATTKRVEIIKQPLPLRFKSVELHGIRIAASHPYIFIAIASIEFEHLYFYLLHTEAYTLVPIVLMGARIPLRINYGLCHVEKGVFFIVGGMNPGGIYCHDSYALDLANGKCRKVRQLPCGADGLSLTALAPGVVGLFGGYGSVHEFSYLQYRMSMNEWTEIPEQTDILPGRRWKPSLFWIDDNSLLIVGGYSGRNMTDLVVYVPEHHLWIPITPELLPLQSREEGMIVRSKDQRSLIVLGGGTSTHDSIDLSILQKHIFVATQRHLQNQRINRVEAQVGAQQDSPKSQEARRDAKSSQVWNLLEEIKRRVRNAGGDQSLLDLSWA
ncbi:Kelch motif-containing protein [Giardia muris]|uniref:Kelch motif-containing protein n=1 Tax=Giardia muris TaxID=5742 RepID=A0A4Z1SXM4_GIAMU|nr:Kelch motif-containing protein [Giardia muris]|eukprot:TNJ28278.1 Kelch motif-containing protein [Giardia muris]